MTVRQLTIVNVTLDTLRRSIVCHRNLNSKTQNARSVSILKHVLPIYVTTFTMQQEAATNHFPAASEHVNQMSRHDAILPTATSLCHNQVVFSNLDCGKKFVHRANERLDNSPTSQTSFRMEWNPGQMHLPFIVLAYLEIMNAEQLLSSATSAKPAHTFQPLTASNPCTRPPYTMSLTRTARGSLHQKKL